MQFPKACLFDLDGVLLDTEPLHGQAWAKTAETFGGNLSKEQLLHLRGRRRKDCAEQLMDWVKEPVKIEDFLSVHQPISSRLLKKSKAMPGAEALVRWCFENKMPMALVSSSSSRSVKLKSAPHIWLRLIQTRVLGDDPSLKEGKPSPDPFLLAAQKLGLEATSCWALEDSASGTQAALRAGCQVWMLANNEQLNSDWNHGGSTSNPRKITHLQEVKSALEISLSKEPNQ